MDDDTGRSVADAFGLGAPLEAPAFVARGAMGEVWKVTTAAGEWAVKALFDWVDAPPRPDDVDVQLAARAAGIRLPRPILVAGEAVVARASGARHRVYEWVDLDPPTSRPAPADRAAEAGELLGRLHQLGLPARGEVDPWYTTPAPASELRALGERARAEGRPWADEFAAALPAVERLRPRVSNDQEAPRLCHRDIDLSNVLPAAGDGAYVVLDWENAGPLAPDAEVASALQSWCCGGGDVRLDSAEAFLAGYRRVGGDAELDPDRSWSMVVSTSVNFLAVMAEQAMADDEHRSFAEHQIRVLCRGAFDEVLASIETLRPLFA